MSKTHREKGNHKWRAAFDRFEMREANAAMVAALNTHDTQLLRKAMALHPNPWAAQFTLHRGNKTDWTAHTFFGAILVEDWGGAVPVLLDAIKKARKGSEKPEPRELLQRATREAKRGVVRALLNHGVSPDGDGVRSPLLDYGLFNTTRQAQYRHERVWRAYLRAGVDVWKPLAYEDTDMKRPATLVEALLKAGQVYAADYFLRHASEQKRQVPVMVLDDEGFGFSVALENAISHHAHGAWPAVPEGYVSCEVGQTSWTENRAGLASICALAAGLGIGPPRPVVADLTRCFEAACQAVAGGADQALIQESHQAALDTVGMLVAAWPCLPLFGPLAIALEPFTAQFDPTERSFLEQAALDHGSVPAVGQARVRL